MTTEMSEPKGGNERETMSQSSDRVPDKDIEGRFLPQLTAELVGVRDRVSEYFELASSDDVDLIMIVVGCDDSREDFPVGVQQLEVEGEDKQVLFHFVPSIGGGLSDVVLPTVVGMYLDKGIKADKLLVLTTQHGNSTEVNTALNGGESEPTCGLRGVLRAHQDDISDILEADESDRLALIKNLSDKSGIPEGLLSHAASTSSSPNIIDNGEWVWQKTAKSLETVGVRVVGGYYDHEGDDQDGKSVHIVLGSDSQWDFSVPDITPWHEPHQDPTALVISFGKESASVPDGIILPTTVGEGVNNDFNSVGIDEDTLWKALYEQWYSLSHVRGHEGDKHHSDDHNFETTELMVIIADDKKLAGVAKDIVVRDRFKKNFGEHVAKIGGLYIVDLDGNGEFIEFGE